MLLDRITASEMTEETRDRARALLQMAASDVPPTLRVVIFKHLFHIVTYALCFSVLRIFDLVAHALQAKHGTADRGGKCAVAGVSRIRGDVWRSVA
jgi:hypothetical protein